MTEFALRGAIEIGGKNENKRVTSIESVPIHLNVYVVRPSKKADTVITQLRFTVMFLTQLRFTIMFLDCMLSNDLLHYLSEYLFLFGLSSMAIWLILSFS